MRGRRAAGRLSAAPRRSWGQRAARWQDIVLQRLVLLRIHDVLHLADELPGDALALADAREEAEPEAGTNHEAKARLAFALGLRLRVHGEGGECPQAEVDANLGHAVLGVEGDHTVLEGLRRLEQERH